MDSIDKKIVKILQKNARTPIKDIAAMVSLSSPAVSTRIAKLEKDGIIQEYNLRLNRERLGYHIIAYILVEMDPSLKPKFQEEVSACNNVLECCHITGQYSHILKAAFKSTNDLDAFLTVIQTYGRTSTQIVLSAHVPPRDNLIDIM